MNESMPALPGFDLFTDHFRRVTKAPTASIHSKGVIALNALCLQKMGEPQAVQMLYNAEQRVIALRPVPEGAPYSMPVRFPNRGSRSAVVSAKAFLDSYGIPSNKAIDLKVSFAGPIALLALPSEAVSDDRTE